MKKALDGRGLIRGPVLGIVADAARADLGHRPVIGPVGVAEGQGTEPVRVAHEHRDAAVLVVVVGTVVRDAPVRKEVEAAHKAQMECERKARQCEREPEKIRGPSRHMGAEIDYGR